MWARRGDAEAASQVHGLQQTPRSKKPCFPEAQDPSFPNGKLRPRRVPASPQATPSLILSGDSVEPRKCPHGATFVGANGSPRNSRWEPACYRGMSTGPCDPRRRAHLSDLRRRARPFDPRRRAHLSESRRRVHPSDPRRRALPCDPRRRARPSDPHLSDLRRRAHPSDPRRAQPSEPRRRVRTCPHGSRAGAGGAGGAPPQTLWIL